MTSSSSMALLIPAELLTHPAIESHPHILALHEQHGGIPEQDVEEALDFANAVATQAVEPGTKSRRTDPSPRRTARVWRSQLLGRDPSVSPERGRDGFAGGDVTVRYRSRSRPPTTATVLEEAGEMRVGRPEAPRAVTGAAHLENRVGTVVQQQHEFNRRVDVVEKRVEAADARNSNKANAHLGKPLVPVSNVCKDAVPRGLKPITSVESLKSLARGELDAWIDYYSGAPPSNNVSDVAAQKALAVFIGVDTDLV